MQYGLNIMDSFGVIAFPTVPPIALCSWYRQINEKNRKLTAFYPKYVKAVRFQ